MALSGFSADVPAQAEIPAFGLPEDCTAAWVSEDLLLEESGLLSGLPSGDALCVTDVSAGILLRR